ncbi:MAG: DUF4189 domain-containing protein [Methylobacteriaceae bacterium]|nr:DUF4189 domain-containing protein [Methylobacteriaceae bacterium]MBV9633869.1 DUF4189 domain-containing protein [Methylobacteriaceae bacterium]MBV9705094.1 DUF4189 domain-containing protein [Methylobacteriaceae bacterium]
MITKISRITVIAATLAATIGMSGRASAAGALAVNKCGAYGYSYNYASDAEASEAALRNCQGDECHVVANVTGACAAFYWDDNDHCGAQGWGYANSRAEAEGIAAKYCADYGGANCVLRAWVCDGS